MKTLLIIAGVAGLAYLGHRMWRVDRGCGCGDCAGCGGTASSSSTPAPDSDDGPLEGFLADAGRVIGDVFALPFKRGLEEPAASPEEPASGCA